MRKEEEEESDGLLSRDSHMWNPLNAPVVCFRDAVLLITVAHFDIPRLRKANTFLYIQGPWRLRDLTNAAPYTCDCKNSITPSSRQNCSSNTQETYVRAYIVDRVFLYKRFIPAIG